MQERRDAGGVMKEKRYMRSDAGEEWCGLERCRKGKLQEERRRK